VERLLTRAHSRSIYQASSLRALESAGARTQATSALLEVASDGCDLLPLLAKAAVDTPPSPTRASGARAKSTSYLLLQVGITHRRTHSNCFHGSFELHCSAIHSGSLSDLYCSRGTPMPAAHCRAELFRGRGQEKTRCGLRRGHFRDRGAREIGLPCLSSPPPRASALP
jgi:hypothetical protein